MLTDNERRTDAGVTGILIAHLGAFGSGELKIPISEKYQIVQWFDCHLPGCVGFTVSFLVEP